MAEEKELSPSVAANPVSPVQSNPDKSKLEDSKLQTFPQPEDVNPVQSDRKRKLESLELRDDEKEEEEEEADPYSSAEKLIKDVGSTLPDAKRPRLDEDPDVTENGHQAEKLNEKPEEVLEGTTEEKLDETPVENQKEQAEGDDQAQSAVLEETVVLPEDANPVQSDRKRKLESLELHDDEKEEAVLREPVDWNALSVEGQRTIPDEKRSCLDDIPSEAFDLQLESVSQSENTIPVQTDHGASERQNDEIETVTGEPVDWNSLSIEVHSPISDEKRLHLDDVPNDSNYVVTLENAAQFSEGNLTEAKPPQPYDETFQSTDGYASSGRDSPQIAGDLEYGVSDDQTMSSELDFPINKDDIKEKGIVQRENVDTTDHMTEPVKIDLTDCFITDQVFNSREALIEWCQEVGRNNMFVIVISKSRKPTRGRSARLLLGCERSGYYRDHKKKSEQPHARKRETGTRKCGCPFMLKGIWMPGDKWKVQVHCGEHNHALPKSLAGHSHVARLNDEEKQLIIDLIKSGARPRQMLNALKEKSKGNMSTIRTIYNAKASLKLMEMKGKSVIAQKD